MKWKSVYVCVCVCKLYTYSKHAAATRIRIPSAYIHKTHSIASHTQTHALMRRQNNIILIYVSECECDSRLRSLPLGEPRACREMQHQECIENLSFTAPNQTLPTKKYKHVRAYRTYSTVQ